MFHPRHHPLSPLTLAEPALMAVFEPAVMKPACGVVLCKSPTQPDPDKTSRPEVVGWPEWNAAFRIRYDKQDVGINIIFLHVGQSRPPGFDPTRVVVFVDANLLVALVPMIG